MGTSDTRETESGTALRYAHALCSALVKTYHRAEAIDVENVPAEGGALIVSNHSGGLISMDVPVIATALWDTFGVGRGFRILAHDLLMAGPWGRGLGALGFLAASPENAHEALRSGSVTVVFPGGDWEAYRPTSKRGEIDFNGRVGYLRSAIAADVPVVPTVSIGGHEALLVLSRGEAIAQAVPWMRNMRTKVAPILVGPFGVSVGFPQPPLPSKIVTRFLEPIHVRAEFGPDPDLHEVDAVIRQRMQAALDELAADRRFPVLG